MTGPCEPAYQGVSVAAIPSLDDLRAAAGDYRAILTSVMDYLLERYDRDPHSPWIDTKFSILTGEDFPADDPIRGKGTVYGWIQGRGLESLALHRRWLGTEASPIGGSLGERMIDPMRRLALAIDGVRRRNRGHAFFFMTPDGGPLTLGGDGQLVPATLSEESPFSFSDLFCARGLYAAASTLGDEDMLARAREWCLSVMEAILDGRFASDQQPLDPANPVRTPPGRRSHGPHMITIGLAALMIDLERDALAVELGLRLIRHIMETHVNVDGDMPGLEQWDYVEFADDAGQPWETDGCVLGDPGHALEFVGLTLKFVRAVRQADLGDSASGELAAIEAGMPKLLLHVFGYGFQDQPGGICKLVDLRTRRVVNGDMPWWSLPETMRAALLCASVAGDDAQRDKCMGVYAACHNSFLRNYVRPERHLFAMQMLGPDGKPADVIPATPDADPGYHTGLALIDCLGLMA